MGRVMCGIAGFFCRGKKYYQKEQMYHGVLQKMRKSLTNRGPDEHGFYLKDHVGLTHTRLSIIDLNTGTQPMKRKIDGYDYVIVYNGELYNTQNLKNDLEQKGWQFQTTSDTEVILLSFLHYGVEFVKRLEGIFAFAIYDGRHDSLFLYRDHFGIKPLFYTLVGEELIFGSEPKAIFCYPKYRPCITKKGLQEIFGMGPARIPGSGVYEGVKEVLPGHYLSYGKSGLRDREYWHLESHPHEDDYNTTIKKTRELVLGAVTRQMVSDVPICTFLSGGIDSSLVSSICQKKLFQNGKKLTTFSFDFDGNEKYFKANAFQPSQDRPYVEKMISYLGSEHHFLSCDYEKQADLLKESVLAHDLPCMADVDSSLLYFCKEVSKTHKVVLTGECADEVFGGYPWFHRSEFFERDGFPWTPDLSPREALLKQEIAEDWGLSDFVDSKYREAIGEIHALPGENETETKRREIGYLNIRFFMQTLLNRMDRTSMHCGLEARVPFADRKLVEYVFNIPWEMKAKNGVVKNILRESSIGFLPDDVLYRKKSPYPKSYHPYYENLLGKRLLSIIEEGESPILELVDCNKVKRFISSVKDYGKPWYGQLMAGPQMLAYLLQIHYWLTEYHIDLRLG